MAILTKNRAILNNIKYNKNDKNIKTLNDITDSEYQKVNDFVTSCQASPQGAIPQEARGIGSSPAPWGYLKLDLFDNATDEQLADNQQHLHAKLSIKRQNNPDWLYASAGLNSEKRMAKRGLRMDNTDDRLHWECVQKVYALMKEDYENIRASKFYKAGSQKGKTIKGLSVVVGQTATVGEYAAVVIKGSDVYPINLTADGLTARQRQRHIIASGEWKDGEGSSNELTVDDFLGE